MLSRIAERVSRAELAPESARHALLEPDVFRARFTEMLGRHPDRTPEQLARRVPGALSYSFVLDDGHYAEGIGLVQEALELQGFQLQARRNMWSSAAHKCVLTVWHDRLTDLTFQVQFHTAGSLDAQHLARTTATLINDPRIPPAEAANLKSDIQAAWAALPAPTGHSGIADYWRESGITARQLPARPRDYRRSPPVSLSAESSKYSLISCRCRSLTSWKCLSRASSPIASAVRYRSLIWSSFAADGAHMLALAACDIARPLPGPGAPAAGTPADCSRSGVPAAGGWRTSGVSGGCGGSLSR